MKYKYPFTNALTFALVMKDPELSRGLLQMIFPNRKIRVVRPQEDQVETEKTVINGIELRKVRLDVLFEDSDEWYDIEMQCRNEHNIPKRSRFAHGAVDVDMLNSGQDFNELKTSFVIFLCCFDFFERGEAMYSFEMYDAEKHLSLGDENYTIILNSKADEERTPKPLRELYRYMNEEIVSGDNELLQQIDASVHSWNTGEGVNTIMTLEEEIRIKETMARKEGHEEGRAEERLDTIRRLSVKLTDEQIKEFGYTEEEIEQAR